MIGAVGRQRQSSTTEKRSKNYRQEILFGIRFNYLLFAFFELHCMDAFSPETVTGSRYMQFCYWILTSHLKKTFRLQITAETKFLF